MLKMPRKQRLTRKGDKSTKARAAAAAAARDELQGHRDPALATAAPPPDPAVAAAAAEAAERELKRARALADYHKNNKLDADFPDNLSRLSRGWACYATEIGC